MIALLRGVLLEKHPNQAIVDVGGVGYDVTIPVSTYTHLPEAGAEVRLRIHTHVREDALALYGFLTQDEKALFEKLISVSGKKTAERMVLELRDKMPAPSGEEAATSGTPSAALAAVEQDVLSALLNLGCARPAAEAAVRKTRVAGAPPPAAAEFEPLFRRALELVR
jgi:Holliday junction DNA helicase RuvA